MSSESSDEALGRRASDTDEALGRRASDTDEVLGRRAADTDEALGRRAADEAHEPVVVTDKRRIDPETGAVREAAAADEPLARRGSDTAAPESDSEEAAELKATLQRVKAEYDNYRKRSVRQEQFAADRAKSAVVAQLLPVLDDLDRARSHGDLESGPMKSVADKLANALEGLGLAGFGDEGDEFDPSLHEAVLHEGGGDEAGTKPVVGTVMRRGYRLGDQVLRHALVGVVDTVDEEEPGEDADTGGNADAAPEQTAESEATAD